MQLVRLVYASRFSSSFDYEGFQKILDISRETNPKKNITGILCYAPGVFLQCLEGPQDAVNNLYCQIVRDDRHYDVTLVDYSHIEERIFAKWSMAYVRADSISEDIIVRFSASSSFNPFNMTGGQALGFVEQLVAAQADFDEI